MTKTERLREAYKLISGELFYLPDKRWKKLEEYRKHYSFIKNSEIRQQVVNFNLALDYQISLRELHKPVGNLEEMSFISVCHLIGSILEALLRDLYFYKLQTGFDRRFSSSLINSPKTNRIMFGELLSIYKNYFDKKDYQYLTNIKNLRNTIHINTTYNNIKILEESGHILTIKIKNFHTNGYLEKKVFHFSKLQEDFNKFSKKIANYY